MCPLGWHEGLIFKLKQNGISGNLLNLFQNYLKNRKQRVVLNGYSSEYSLVESGVPQGSVLAPLLFLIYINDLETKIRSNIIFFADDTMLFSIVKKPEMTASDLNQDLEEISSWAFQWKLQFNPDVNKQATEMLFTSKNKGPPHPNLFFNGNLVTKSFEQKHLGLILEPGLSFQKHILEKIKKAKKYLVIIKRLSNFFPVKTLCQMYKTLVRSHLDYCDIIYHISSIHSQTGIILPGLMEQLENLQYQTAMCITGTWKGTNRSKSYGELGWESPSE